MAVTLTAHQLRTIAALAGCDPRSVRKIIRGERVAPMVSQRIRAALDECGFASDRLPTPQSLEAKESR